MVKIKLLSQRYFQATNPELIKTTYYSKYYICLFISNNLTLSLTLTIRPAASSKTPQGFESVFYPPSLSPLRSMFERSIKRNRPSIFDLWQFKAISVPKRQLLRPLPPPSSLVAFSHLFPCTFAENIFLSSC